MEKHAVVLLPQEKKKLKAIVSTGQNKAAVIRRAHILLKADEGKTDDEISEILYVSEQTIRRTRLRYETEGLQAALEDKPHPKPAPKLTEQQEAHLVAVRELEGNNHPKLCAIRLYANNLRSKNRLHNAIYTNIRTI